MVSNQYELGVAGIIEVDGKVLLGRRSLDKDVGAGMWELPSGRFMQGESPEEALRREIHEELGVIVKESWIVDAYTFKRKGTDFLLLVYACAVEGEIRKSDEHSEIRFVSPEEAKDLLDYPRMRDALERHQAVYPSIPKTR